MRRITLFLLTMAFLAAIPVCLKAQNGVENYVSASGFVVYHAPSYYTGTEGYAYDFEADYGEGRLLDWTTIDADGDSYNWNVSPIGEGYGHHGSNGVMMSYSYDNYAGVLNPDNYLVSPLLSVTNNSHIVNFFACALDESYPDDHFGLAVSTTDNLNASSFTMIQEWTMSAKQGNWYQYTVDLSAYVGQEVYIAIRHFNSADKFCLCVDDIVVGDGTLDPLTGCDISLDGATVAQGLKGIRYLLDTDGFADGSVHTTMVRASYQSGATLQQETDWTFLEGDHFAGSPSGLHADSDGAQVTLSWDLPMNDVPFSVDELFYDFADSTLSDLTLIDANHDGRNFRVYPYGGYGSGKCLKSDSWVAGGVGNVDPDNFVVLPRVTATAASRISFMAVDCDMPGTVTEKEHFGVAVSTAGNTNAADFAMVSEWNSTGTYTEYSADLSAYAGQEIYVAIRHFNTTGDVYFLYVDDIRVTGIQAEVTRPAKGAMVYSNGELIASLTHGETSFVHAVNRYDSEYCIRIIQDGSRESGDYFALAAPQCATTELECLAPKNLAANWDGEKVSLSWEREIGTSFEEDPEGWAFLDADEDGFVFGIYAAGGMDPDGTPNTTGTNPSLTSFSYINEYGGLTPDNYAFMPLVRVLPNASMTFWAAGFDPSYPSERFGVAVASEDGMEINTLQTWTTGYPYAQYTVDLSAYAGQRVYLGFRHCSTTPAYALCIDNITVTNVVWAGTASETVHYKVYRSYDGEDYDLIGYADGDEVSYDDYDISALNCYYQVTAVNSIVGGACESEPALAVDGIHDYVQVTTDGVEEQSQGFVVYPNPSSGLLNLEAVGMTRVTVANVMGQVVYEAAVQSDKMVLDLTRFDAGIYSISVIAGEQAFAKRIVLNH